MVPRLLLMVLTRMFWAVAAKHGRIHRLCAGPRKRSDMLLARSGRGKGGTGMVSDSFAADLVVIIRLLAAAAVGVALGWPRNMADKPIGMRTLGLVSLGAAMVSIAALRYPGL